MAQVAALLRVECRVLVGELAQVEAMVKQRAEQPARVEQLARAEQLARVEQLARAAVRAIATVTWGSRSTMAPSIQMLM